MSVDIVTTFDGVNRRFQLIKRLNGFLKELEKCNLKIVIGIQVRDKFDEKIVKYFTSRYPNAKFACDYKKTSSIGNSKLRNLAINASTAEYLLFLDLDIYPDSHLIDKIISGSGTSKIEIYPCVYLTKEGTKLFLKGNQVSNVYSWLKDFRVRYVQHLAIPSSIVFLPRAIVNAIGGFDENYVGHGYEDFDFLIRVEEFISGKKYSILDLIDEPYNSPIFSIGFRHRLGMYCWDNLKAGDFFVHLWHSRSQTKQEDRTVNKRYFEEKLEVKHNLEELVDGNREIYLQEKLSHFNEGDLRRYEFLFHKFNAK